MRCSVYFKRIFNKEEEFLYRNIDIITAHMLMWFGGICSLLHRENLKNMVKFSDFGAYFDETLP